MSKVYVIADESIGGVLREYIEDPEYCFGYGDYVVVKHTDYKDYTVKYREEMIVPSGCCINLLRPTDIVTINGSRYRLIERKAKVGEKVLVSNHTHREEANGVFTVDRAHDDGHIHYGVYGRKPGGYRVLEPLESEEVTVDTSQASEQVIEMLANLARRVTSLERQLADTQRNLETFAEQTESNSEDIRTLDERTQAGAMAKAIARRLSL
jgi:hypothetical protein